MKQLTFFEERNIRAEWDELISPHLKGISGGCYLCPMHRLCKGGHFADGNYRDDPSDKLEDVMEYIIDNYDFEEYYKKWKLEMLHKMIKRERREWWKHYNGIDNTVDFDIPWTKHWLDSLEQIEKEQRWNWTLEEEWTDYKKWRREKRW